MPLDVGSTHSCISAKDARIAAGKRYFALAVRNAANSTASIAVNSREASADAPRLMVTRPDTATPTLTAASSRRTHGPAGDFDLPLSLDPAAFVEPRLGGTSTIVLRFNEPVFAVDGVLDGSEFSVTTPAISRRSRAATRSR